MKIHFLEIKTFATGAGFKNLFNLSSKDLRCKEGNEKNMEKYGRRVKIHE